MEAWTRSQTKGTPQKSDPQGAGLLEDQQQSHQEELILQGFRQDLLVQ